MATDPHVALKREAGIRAVDFVEDGMALGLGTGSTARFVAEEIAVRLHDGRLRGVACVPTSNYTRRLADSLRLPLTTLEDHPILDIAIDGADEVDPTLDLIKGAGGALLREKIVATAARRFVVVVDETKLVKRLGERAAVPIEVIPFGWKTHLPAILELGCSAQLRLTDTGNPFQTDEENYILDTSFDHIAEPAALEQAIRSRPGVVEIGLFLNMAQTVVVGRPGGIEILERPSHP